MLLCAWCLCVLNSYLFEPAVLQKRFDARFLATEVLVHVHGVVNATRCEDVLAELVGHFEVEAFDDRD